MDSLSSFILSPGMTTSLVIPGLFPITVKKLPAMKEIGAVIITSA